MSEKIESKDSRPAAPTCRYGHYVEFAKALIEQQQICSHINDKHCNEAKQKLFDFYSTASESEVKHILRFKKLISTKSENLRLSGEQYLKVSGYLQK